MVTLKNWPLRMDLWFLSEETKSPFDTRYGAEISWWPSNTLILFISRNVHSVKWAVKKTNDWACRGGSAG